MKGIIHRYGHLLLKISIILLYLCNVELLAAKSRTVGDQFKLQFNISGTVVANGNCTFETGPTSVVEFGDIHYYQSGGGDFSLKGDYRKKLYSSMNCSGDTEGAIMTFTTSNSSPLVYDGHKVLPVTLNGKLSKNIAIALLVDDSIQDINASFAVNTNTPPVIEAEIITIGKTEVVANGSAMASSVTLTLAFP